MGVCVYGLGYMVIPASSPISYAEVLVRVPPRGSNYTGSSEKMFINAPTFKGSFNQCYSKQSAQSGSAHPAQIPSWLSQQLSWACWGQVKDGEGFAGKGLQNAVTQAYSCPNSPQQICIQGEK